MIDFDIFASVDPVMPGHSVEEAGCICLDLPIHSSGLPWPAQLHSAQQTKGGYLSQTYDV